MIAPGGRDGAPDREHDPLRVLPLDGVAAVFGDVPAAVARKAGQLRRRVLLAARPIVQRYRPSVNHQRAEEARLRRSKLLADRLREHPPGHSGWVQAVPAAPWVVLPRSRPGSALLHASSRPCRERNDMVAEGPLGRDRDNGMLPDFSGADSVPPTSVIDCPQRPRMGKLQTSRCSPA